MGRFKNRLYKVELKRITLIAAACAAFFLFLVLIHVQIKKALIVCVLLTTILFWTTNLVPKWAASIFLLLSFAAARAAPFPQLFKFALSQNFLLIAFSYLFAEGIKKSKLFHPALPFIQKFVRGIGSFAVSVLILYAAAIWIIPQPYTRIVILLQLYGIYFEALNLSERCRRILSLWIVNTAMFLNAAFFKGDIILNGVLLEIGGLKITELEWCKWMLIPTVLYTIMGMALFYFVFRKELAEFRVRESFGDETVAATDKTAVSIVFCTVLLWLSEPFTHILPVITLILAAIAMYLNGIITVRDIKSINLGLLIFLTAAFSISPAMNNSGVTESIFSFFIRFMPDSIGYRYLLIIICIGMILHMILGSCVTVISVVIPSVLMLAGNTPYLYPVVFIVFIGCVTHYIFCIHNVLLVVGMGIGRYSDIETRKYGKWLTPFVAVFAIPIYMIYWGIANLY